MPAVLQLCKKYLVGDKVDVNVEDLPLELMKKTMQVLNERRFKGIKTVPIGDEAVDKHDFNDAADLGFGETEWIAAAKERSRAIIIHIPLPEEVLSEKDVSLLTKEIHLAFPHAKINVKRNLTWESADREQKLVWALEFASQMHLRACCQIC